MHFSFKIKARDIAVNKIWFNQKKWLRFFIIIIIMQSCDALER